MIGVSYQEIGTHLANHEAPSQQAQSTLHHPLISFIHKNNDRRNIYLFR